jgi:hypothetical protein
MIIAKPIAASAAATPITNKTKTCPKVSPEKLAKVIKVRFTEFNINSIDKKMMITLLRVRTPIVPIMNNIADNIR